MALNLTGIQPTGGSPNLIGFSTGPVTAGGQLTPEDAALQRDLQRLLFGDQGLYTKLAARGIPLTDAGGDMSPEAAYYASLAATEFAGTREQQLAERDFSQQRINIASREADQRGRQLSNQTNAALATGAASLGQFAFGRPDSPGRALTSWLWDRYGGRATPEVPGVPTISGADGGGAGTSPMGPLTDEELQSLFPGLTREQAIQALTQDATFGVPEGFTLPAEFGGLEGPNAPVTDLYDPETLAALSAYLGTPMDFGSAPFTGLSDMDALLSFLA